MITCAGNPHSCARFFQGDSGKLMPHLRLLNSKSHVLHYILHVFGKSFHFVIDLKASPLQMSLRSAFRKKAQKITSGANAFPKSFPTCPGLHVCDFHELYVSLIIKAGSNYD